MAKHEKSTQLAAEAVAKKTHGTQSGRLSANAYSTTRR